MVYSTIPYSTRDLVLWCFFIPFSPNDKNAIIIPRYPYP
nr:MAG TPA: hypothetical protein [Caudoviricetes sp.]